MKTEYIHADGIPSILWGDSSDRIFIYVHGKNSCKEEAGEFAGIADRFGFQTLSFDLPGCGERGNICSACLPEPCDLEHVSRDLNVILKWAEESYSDISLFVRDHAGFCRAAFAGKSFSRCIFVSPDSVAGLNELGERVSIGDPSGSDFESFVRSSM